jgi:hypothetical protein
VVHERLSALMRRELGRRLGIPPHAPPEHFIAANTRRQVVDPPTLERITRQLAVHEAQRRPEPFALLRLAGEIHRMLHKK